MTGPAVPFTVAVPDATLDKIKARVRAYEWTDDPQRGWEIGPSTAYMKEFCTYWTERFDWRAQEEKLNVFPQFRRVLEVGGQPLAIHYYYEKGSSPHSRPLLLQHGWPGSVFEFLHLIDTLAHPERHGGRAEDGFDVVVPSLPGYGFSDRPKSPVGLRTTARALHALMTEGLGYNKYMVQGGDWGALVTAWMAFFFPQAVVGLHLNMVGVLTGAHPQTEEEKAHYTRASDIYLRESGYSHVHRTKPDSLGFALSDSPVGTAAWILDKFFAWSDLDTDSQGRGDIESVYTKDHLLTNIMIYLVTQTIRTSIWFYRGFDEEGAGRLPDGGKIEVPTAIAKFRDGIGPIPPRSHVEKSYNVNRWTEMARGGHFAALERGDLLLEDIRAFARELKY